VVVSLQVTALLLFAGIVLGAIWAGEAWGRPWGWDMKENWALVSLLAYAAILHLRMTGRLGGCALAVASIAGFGVILLTYFGVNLIFGRGLHTYGFGQGSMMPLILYGLVETAYVGIFLILGSLRNGREVPAPV
jgi:cytochrome c biogenesis factor